MYDCCVLGELMCTWLCVIVGWSNCRGSLHGGLCVYLCVLWTVVCNQEEPLEGSDERFHWMSW